LEFYKEKSIKYISQKKSGRGSAILEGFDAYPQYDGYIIFSPDGNEDLGDLPKFIEGIECNNDLIIASRMLVGAHNEEDPYFLKPRKWANNIFNLIINILFNKSEYVSDSINGYRAISRSALNRIKLDACDYTIEYQMTIRCMKLGLTITEFSTFEGQRNYGQTGAPSIETGVKFLLRLIKEIFHKC
jgi:hypothetical protein